MRVNTFAFGILLSCAFASVTVATHVDDMTQLLNGLATNVQGSIDTSSIVGCGSESIFAAFEAGFLPIMDEVASCNPLDFSDIESKITALAKTIPDASKTCVNNNAEAKKLLTGLGIAGLTPDQIKSKVTSYVMDNLFSICGTFGDLNDKLKGGDFTGFGTEAGKVALDIFKSSRSHRQVAKDIVFALMSAELGTGSDNFVQLLKSIVSKTTVAGTDVTSFASCVDEPTASSLLDAMTQASALVATCTPDNMNKAGTIFNDFATKVSKDKIMCIYNDSNFQTVLKSIGLDAATAGTTVTNFISYALTHIVEICGYAKLFNDDLVANNFNQCGVDIITQWLEMTA